MVQEIGSITKNIYGISPSYAEINTMPNGDLFISSTNQLALPFDPELLWLDSLGNYKRGFQFANGPNGALVKFALPVNDNHVIVGINRSSDGFALVSIDSLGSINWQKEYCDGSSKVIDAVNNDDGTITIAIDAGNPACAYNAVCPTQLIISCIDSSGNSVWSNHYWAYDNFPIPRSLKQTADSGYVVLSTALFPQIGGGFRNGIILMKIDKSGNFQWARRYWTSPFDDFASDVNLTKDGGYVFIGMSCAYHAPVPFCGPSCCFDNYLVTTDSLGNGNSCNDTAITFYSCPVILPDSQATYSIVAPVVTVSNASIIDSIISTPVTFNGCTITSQEELNTQQEYLRIYPNPSNHEIVFGVGLEIVEDVSLVIINTYGQKSYVGEIDDLPCTINISDLSPGIYLIKLTHRQKEYSGRFIKL